MTVNTESSANQPTFLGRDEILGKMASAQYPSELRALAPLITKSKFARILTADETETLFADLEARRKQLKIRAVPAVANTAIQSVDAEPNDVDASVDVPPEDIVETVRLRDYRELAAGERDDD